MSKNNNGLKLGVASALLATAGAAALVSQNKKNTEQDSKESTSGRIK